MRATVDSTKKRAPWIVRSSNRAAPMSGGGAFSPPPQAIRAHRPASPKFGGLPCISSPILNTFAANHTAIHAPAIPPPPTQTPATAVAASPRPVARAWRTN